MTTPHKNNRTTANPEKDLNTLQFEVLTEKHRRGEDYPLFNCNNEMLQINLSGGATMRHDVLQSAAQWIRWHADANCTEDSGTHHPNDNRALGVIAELINTLTYEDAV